MKARTFIDSVVVHAEAGDGGNGSVSFRREIFVPYGGPDGGDGGDGGSVILCASPDEDSLIRLYFTPHQRAKPGAHGRGQQIHGRNGADVRIPVPCGTTVCDRDSGELLADLVKPGDEYVAARGGRGGRGNTHYKSSTNRAPRQHTPGEEGQKTSLRLELKIVSDFGLVGFPNAGKSSIISKLSDAHPKIAAYPFTTLNPIIGTLVYGDYVRIRVADIPGVVKGAHEGTGLGHEFLRHIERAPNLIYVIDMAGVDGRLPWEDYKVLRQELECHDASLAKRPFLVVANKMDLPEFAENLKTFRRKTRQKPLCLSASTGDGVDALKEAIREAWDRRTV